METIISGNWLSHIQHLLQQRKGPCSIMHIADKEACDYSHVQALYSRQLPKVKLMLISCETKIKILCLDTLPSVEIHYS